MEHGHGRSHGYTAGWGERDSVWRRPGPGRFWEIATAVHNKSTISTTLFTTTRCCNSARLAASEWTGCQSASYFFFHATCASTVFSTYVDGLRGHSAVNHNSGHSA